MSKKKEEITTRDSNKKWKIKTRKIKEELNTETKTRKRYSK
jgi:hypothetical protein